MFTKVTARVGRAAALGLIVATMGLGFVGTGGAHAQDNGEGAGASCFYGGVEYSEGSVIRQADGALYRCKDGGWVFECGGCVSPAAAGVLTTDGGNLTPKGGVLTQQGGIRTLHMAR